MRLGTTEALTVIICTIIGTGLGVGEWLRRALRRREDRNRQAFKQSVQAIVDASAVDVIERQMQFERRVQQHLERQDRAIARLPGAIRNGEG
jgi:NAD(P)H-hydrate repair Nnr-like enzyme with NAD(P)H-hydrate dehydratase domain